MHLTPREPLMNPLLHNRMNVALLTIALIGLMSGLRLMVTDNSHLATIAWAAGVFPVLAALLVEIVRSLAKGEVGLDIVAALSMSAALSFGETLAAAVVALMYSGGSFLESFAEGRARREMSDLLSRVPRTATRYRDDALDEVPAGRHRTGRSAIDPAGRRCSGGRCGRERPRDAGSVGAYRRGDAGGANSWHLCPKAGFRLICFPPT